MPVSRPNPAANRRTRDRMQTSAGGRSGRDHAGERVLRQQRQLLAPRRPRRAATARFVSTSKPASGGRRRWRPSGRPAWRRAWRRRGREILGLGREADHDLARRLARAELGEDVERSARGRSRAPVALLQLGVAGALGRKSATAAAMTMTSWLGARARTAACISAAVSTRTTSDAGRRPAARRW